MKGSFTYALKITTFNKEIDCVLIFAYIDIIHSRISAIISIKALLRNSTIFIMNNSFRYASNFLDFF